MENLTLLIPHQIDSLLEKTLHLLPDGIILIDRHATITYINQTAQDAIVRHKGKLTIASDDLLALVAPERQDFIRSCIRDAFRNKVTVFEQQLPMGAGEEWLEIRYFPIADEAGTIAHVGVHMKDITDKMMLQRELEQQRRSQKNRLVKAALDAQERERTEIGRELHDNVNQVLTTIKLYNEICLSEEQTNKRLMLKSIQQVNYCIEAIRDLSKTLSGPSAGEMDLVDAIRELVNSINTTRRIHVNFLTYGLKNEKIGQDLQTTIYRIAQEQLTNILKYAQAIHVDVMLVGTTSSVALSIQDDGKGFDLSKNRKGVGITNMISRAETLDGQIEFLTSPGNGCTMMVEFPV